MIYADSIKVKLSVFFAEKKKALKISSFLLTFAIFSLCAKTSWCQSWAVSSNKFSVKSAFSGIWQGADRILMFANLNSVEPALADSCIMLKTLYGWYYDRSAEIDFSSENFNGSIRDLNNVTGSNAEKIKVSFAEIQNSASDSEGAWELELKYADNSVSIVPAARIGSSIFLNFLVKQQEDAEPSIYGAWLGVGQAEGICISPVKNAGELTSLYITDDSVYYIRYWQTDMVYSSQQATFSDGEKTFYIAKHIKSAGKIFTCVSGRGTQIRNVRRSPLQPDDFLMNKSGTVLTFEKPYLTLLDPENFPREETAVMQEYLDIAKKANSRRKTPPAPLFPVKELDWHWNEINELEKYNTQIQSVRERQRNFARQSQNSKINGSIESR